MENFDFIKNNNKARNEEQKEIELVCRTIVDDMRSSIYDGSNRYAPKVGVCCKDGKYYWGEQKENREHFLFYPSTEVIKKALAIFKEKGYHPYYDNDVRFYQVAKDRSEVKGDWAIRHTVWL